MTPSVIVCRLGGETAEEAESTLTQGRRVALALGVDLRWLLLGAPPDGYRDMARRQGVGAVDVVVGPDPGAAGADVIVEAVARYWHDHPGRVLVFAQTFDARLLAPRIAARLGAGVVTNVAGVEVGEGGGLSITAAAYGGDTRVVYEAPPGTSCVVALQAGSVTPEPADGDTDVPAVEEIPMDLSGVTERVRVVSPARSEGPRLEDADVIVAGGRGLGSVENYRLVAELAEVLGGIAGASRPIVDEGWIDSAHQVGLTGKFTHPNLYLAAGISGATQHMVGCTAAKTIVAINTDPDAAIFRYARYGIVGDCVEILPELIRAAKDAGVHR